ncbi:hypothetical protein GCM10027347_59460 [Larkinella harenae]
MSHFTVMVVTDSPDDVKSALQPFHEYECTGKKDKYVIWFDMSEELTKQFKEGKTTMRLMPDGSYLQPYNDKDFQIEISEQEYKAIQLLKPNDAGYFPTSMSKSGNEPAVYTKTVWPEGASIVEMTYEEEAQIEGVTFEEWAKDWGGAEREDGQPGIGRWTNPNKKWDWWTIGGRWQGMLKLKDSSKGVQGEKSWTNMGEPMTGYDQAQISNLDYEAMRKEYRKSAKETWDKAQLCEDVQIREWRYGIKPGMTEEQFIANKSHFWTFAVLMDGKWYESGEMGWWGTVTNEKDDWQEQFTKILETIPSEKWITIVDCHI